MECGGVMGSGGHGPRCQNVELTQMKGGGKNGSFFLGRDWGIPGCRGEWSREALLHARRPHGASEYTLPSLLLDHLPPEPCLPSPCITLEASPETSSSPGELFKVLTPRTHSPRWL